MTKSKKILIVTNGFYPEISPRSFRATELAKEFSRQGNQVTVCTHNRDGVIDFAEKNGFRFLELDSLSWPKPVDKGTGIPRFIRRVIVRLSTLLFEYPLIQLIPLVGKALKKENGYDLMISVAAPFPIHWGVARIRTKKNPIAKVWVADCGDPYMGQENDTFKAPFYFGWVEKWFCRKADFITVPTVNSIGGYYKEFHSKIKVIPQGFKFEDIELYNGSKEDNKIIFGYGGMFIPGKRDPSELLTFLNSLDKSYNFEFHIFTNTPDIILPYIEESKGRIQLKKPLDRKILLYEMSKMDFVVNFDNVGTKQTPSKLIDYAIIKKPILPIKFGDLNTSLVLDFLKNDYTHSFVVSDSDQYRIENVTQKFLLLTK